MCKTFSETLGLQISLNRFLIKFGSRKIIIAQFVKHPKSICIKIHKGIFFRQRRMNQSFFLPSSFLKKKQNQKLKKSADFSICGWTNTDFQPEKGRHERFIFFFCQKVWQEKGKGNTAVFQNQNIAICSGIQNQRQRLVLLHVVNKS